MLLLPKILRPQDDIGVPTFVKDDLENGGVWLSLNID